MVNISTWQRELQHKKSNSQSRKEHIDSNLWFKMWSQTFGWMWLSRGRLHFQQRRIFKGYLVDVLHLRLLTREKTCAGLRKRNTKVCQLPQENLQDDFAPPQKNSYSDTLEPGLTPILKSHISSLYVYILLTPPWYFPQELVGTVCIGYCNLCEWQHPYNQSGGMFHRLHIITSHLCRSLIV